MRPIRSSSSERIRLSSRLAPSPPIVSLDVEVERLSPKKVKRSFRTVESKELAGVQSHGKQVAGAKLRTELLLGNSGYHPRSMEPVTAIIGRHSETIERQHMTANELQKLLYSTDVAKILLDMNLNIRFFTPATKLMFNVTPDDIGRSLEGLSSLVLDGALMNDARKVLRTFDPIEREIEARSGAWYLRRTLPYRNEDKGIEGIVITFADISHQKEATAALEHARMQADSANVAKSRFLAAASHDLRQPLQTLVLLQELLAKIVVGEKAQKLLGRLDQTLGAMSGMLNALLDINQIEAGTVRAEFETFRIDALLERVTVDLAYQAEAQRITPSNIPSVGGYWSDAVVGTVV